MKPDRVRLCTHITALFLLTLLPVISGCLGGGSGTTTAATTVSVPTISSSILPESIQSTRQADGSIEVSWTTRAPIAGGFILLADLHFQGHPLYGASMKEALATPATTHRIRIPASDASELRFMIVHSNTDYVDNGGKGYLIN